ncbi:hypothetical protein PAXRUDRAFT_172564, partial [Paxillus rubicundulus Ve08.2h10]
TDVGGDSAKMRRLLVQKFPHLTVVDCWAHQVNLIVGDIFKLKGVFAKIIDDALEVVKWFNNHSQALGILCSVQRSKLEAVLCLILPVLMRWTSHYLCICRLLELELMFKETLLQYSNKLLLTAGPKTDAKRKAAEVIAIV